MIFSAATIAQTLGMAAQRVASLVSLAPSTGASDPGILAGADPSAFVRQTGLPIPSETSVPRPSVFSLFLPQTKDRILPSRSAAGVLAMMAPVLSGFDGARTFGLTLLGLSAAVSGGVIVASAGANLVRSFRTGGLITRHFPEESKLYWTQDRHSNWVSRSNWETQVLKNAVWLVEDVLKLSPEKQRTEIDRLVRRWNHLYHNGESTHGFHLRNAHLVLTLKRLSELVPESFDRTHLFLFRAMLTATWQRYTETTKTIETNLERVHPLQAFES